MDAEDDLVDHLSAPESKIALFRSLFRGRDDAGVPLPVDPQWKSDYAASVRRLVRDGVDVPLANLFVHVARTVVPDAEGIERGVPPRRSFTGDLKPCRKPPVSSGLMPSCRFPLTDGGVWKWICFVPTRALPWNWTAASI